MPWHRNVVGVLHTLRKRCWERKSLAESESEDKLQSLHFLLNDSENVEKSCWLHTTWACVLGAKKGFFQIFFLAAFLPQWNVDTVILWIIFDLVNLIRYICIHNFVVAYIENCLNVVKSASKIGSKCITYNCTTNEMQAAPFFQNWIHGMYSNEKERKSH